ncbi:hypothetical protein Nepgr_018679 [Nepenthes gracilis]|uniref:Homeobox-leucine zipper protein n=1 Tax=Nepenthes gracilis TaxID=150966 RepID=A0AAD3SSN3_NEPGR|nr:hypothetical protein Nepgr_018679 [Nepenthes gracilis]
MAGSSSSGGGGGGHLYGCGASNMKNLFLTQTLPCSSQPLEAFVISGSSSSLMGSSSMVYFEDVCGVKRTDRFFFSTSDVEENGNEDLDYHFHQCKKKSRLAAEQVQFLERSYEVENKLEPERKIQIAKDLGLQPRQVAIWFQNRRARCKTKQLEKDFESLQASYNSLEADYENLLKEKEKLKAEVLHLTSKLQHHKEKEQEDLDLYNMNIQSETPGHLALHAALKHEDLSSANSDVFDSDSPCHIEFGQHSFTEPGDSSYVFEPEQSDLSQGEEDDLSKSLLSSSYIFPANSCYFGFHVEDHTSWFQSY